MGGQGRQPSLGNFASESIGTRLSWGVVAPSSHCGCVLVSVDHMHGLSVKKALGCLKTRSVKQTQACLVGSSGPPRLPHRCSYSVFVDIHIPALNTEC